MVDPNPIDAAIDQAMPLTAGGTGWRLRNAIRIRQRQQSLLDLGAFTHADLARVWGVSSGTVRQRIARARDRHRLVTVDVGGVTHIPAVFFDERLEIVDTFESVVASLEADRMDAWLIWEWISLPNGRISDAVVADIIHTQPNRVLRALPELEDLSDAEWASVLPGRDRQVVMVSGTKGEVVAKLAQVYETVEVAGTGRLQAAAQPDALVVGDPGDLLRRMAADPRRRDPGSGESVASDGG